MRVVSLGVVVLAILLAGLAIPSVQACTSSGNPTLAVHAVVKEGERTILDIPTGREYRYDPCNRSDVGAPQFDGRYLAWTAKDTFTVFDVNETRPVSDLEPGTLAAGRILSSADGARVRSHDIASGTDSFIAAPPRTLIRPSPQGMVYAVHHDTSQAYGLERPQLGFWLYDVPSQSWVVEAHRMNAPGWETANVYVHIAARDWVIVEAINATGRSLWAFDVSAKSLHGPLPTAIPQGQDSGTYGPAGGRGTPVAIGVRDDRLYMVQQTGGWGAPYSEAHWSIALPGGGDARAGPMPQEVIWGRTASFRAAPESTASSGPLSGSSTTDTGSDSTSRAASASVAVMLVAAAGVAVVRRRLE